MSLEFVITGADAAAAKLQSAGGRVRDAIRKAMMAQWYGLQNAVVTEKLSGQVLHRRTGVLASSINVGGSQTATDFTESDDMFVGRVGTRVEYAGVHEYGGTVKVQAHNRTISQVFGRAVTPHEIFVRSYTATYPERSFLRSTLKDKSAQITDAIQKAVTAALGGA